MLTCIVLIAGGSAIYALVNVQTGYSTPKLELTVPSSVLTTAASSVSAHVIIVNSNLTWNGTYQNVPLLNLNQSANSSVYMQMRNLQQTLGQSQIGGIIGQADNYWHLSQGPSRPTIVYSSSDGKTTTFVIKF